MSYDLILDWLDVFDFKSYAVAVLGESKSTQNPNRDRFCCPFCTDTRFRFYVYYPKGQVYCQNCKYSPRGLIKFLADIERVPSSEIEALLKHGDEFSYGVRKSVEDVVEELFEVSEVEFDYTPISFDHSVISLLETSGIPLVDVQLKEARQYLYDRSFSQQDIKEFDLRYCFGGTNAGRIIIPCYFNGDLVTYSGRDVTGRAKQKYLNPAGNPQSDFLFNWDRIEHKGTIVVVEGQFNAIRVSKSAPVVATFGTKLSNRQVSLLNNFDEVIFYWDTDAYMVSTSNGPSYLLEKYAEKLQTRVRTVLHSNGSVDAADRTVVENTELIRLAVPFSSLEYRLFILEHFSA